MADFSSLKQTIQSYIKQNGNEEITGNILQDVLLAMVSTMGDSAINSLASALQDEITARQNQDGTLQGNITAETTARQQADTALGGRIDGLQTSFNGLQTAVNGINTKLAEGYIYAGIATPSINPGTPSGKVFYVATASGTYTNFGGQVLTQGINILCYNGSAWSSQQIIGIDNVPTPESSNLVKSGEVASRLINIEKNVFEVNPITVSCDDGFYNIYGGLQTSSGFRHTDKIDVQKGDVLYIDSFMENVNVPLIAMWNDDSYVGYYESKKGTGTAEVITDYEFICPDGVNKIAVNSSNADDPIVKTITNSSYLPALNERVYGIEGMLGGKRYSKTFTRSSTTDIFQLKGVTEFTIYNIENTTTLTQLAVYATLDIDGSHPTISAINLKMPKTTRTLPSKGTVNLYCSAASKPNEGTLAMDISTEGLSKEVLNLEDNCYKRYGLRWKVSDYDDYGERCFDAVGKSATIGIGSTRGRSDFDNIYPWSQMKRCNVKTNANGAKIVTYEGEGGFALDGSNGDVFVRIPKFYIDKYTQSGYEYRIISGAGSIVHPAFIEDGKELDEIFVAAFEGYKDENNKIRSYGGVIPTSNYTGQQFLDMAKENGDEYSLYDMRCVDALWMLISIEFGNRNVCRIFGYGISERWQPIAEAGSVSFKAINTSASTNDIVIPTTDPAVIDRMYVGTNICICRTAQTNIIAIRKITAVTIGTGQVTFTFDGTPISIDTECFCGGYADYTNSCENYDGTEKLTYHTGRANHTDSSSSALAADTINPMRYRWIENLWGDLWHLLPDVSFQDQQMYICDNMKDYVFHKHVAPYRPVGALLPLQQDNGSKPFLITGRSYTVLTLMDDTFAKGVTFGKTFSNEVSLEKCFGANYQLEEGNMCIANGGGFDHERRCNILLHRAWINESSRWYLYGCRLIFKNII